MRHQKRRRKGRLGAAYHARGTQNSGGDPPRYALSSAPVLTVCGWLRGSIGGRPRRGARRATRRWSGSSLGMGGRVGGKVTLPAPAPARTLRAHESSSNAEPWAPKSGEVRDCCTLGFGDTPEPWGPKSGADCVREASFRSPPLSSDPPARHLPNPSSWSGSRYRPQTRVD